MSLKKLLPLAVAAASLFAASSAFSAAVVTLNPQADNGLGLAGVIDATEPKFDATGFVGSLGSVLTISGAAGVQTFSETGRIAVSDFQFNNANLNTNVASNYNIFADFVLTGAGAWTGNQFNANPGGASLTFSLGADTDSDNIVDFVLGTGSLDPNFPALAFTILTPIVIPGNTAPSAFTSFSATIEFDPAAGTEGVGGFFEAPSPFSIDVFAGNVGGTLNDTTYTVNPITGEVVITTVGGSGNFDFVQDVPEPSALALVGLALAGAGLVSRRRKQVVQA